MFEWLIFATSIAAVVAGIVWFMTHPFLDWLLLHSSGWFACGECGALLGAFDRRCRRCGRLRS